MVMLFRWDYTCTKQTTDISQTGVRPGFFFSLSLGRCWGELHTSLVKQSYKKSLTRRQPGLTELIYSFKNKEWNHISWLQVKRDHISKPIDTTCLYYFWSNSRSKGVISRNPNDPTIFDGSALWSYHKWYDCESIHRDMTMFYQTDTTKPHSPSGI